MSERDFKFNSFAVLLFDEVLPLMQAWEQAHQAYDSVQTQQIEAQIQDVFARRGYDFIYQAIEFLRYSPYIRPMHLSSTETWVHFIPDMKEWPKYE